MVVTHGYKKHFENAMSSLMYATFYSKDGKVSLRTDPKTGPSNLKQCLKANN